MPRVLLHKLARRLARQDGFVLAIALVTMVALGAAAAASLGYVTQNQGSANRSRADQSAYALAEAAMNLAYATLGNPAVNALSSTALPSTSATARTAAYDLGTARWWGQLNTQTQTWSIVGQGVVRNPTGAANVVRTVSVQVDVLSDLTQPLNNQAWNFLMSTRTQDADGCDMELRNSVTLAAPLYVFGNFCLSNSASMMPATAPPTPAPLVNLVVSGAVRTYNSSHIGTSGQKIAAAYIAGGCNGNNPCRWNGGGDPVYATQVGPYPGSPVTKPQADWDYWYQNAQPGPRHPCTVTAGTGGPVFDNNSTRDAPNGSAGTWNLTPATDYTCRVVAGNGAVVGELSWNHTTKILNVRGVIYIDGSVTMSNSAVANYNGQASLYVSGTFTMSNSTRLCGGMTGSSCDFAAWNPNTELLLVMAGGDDGTRHSISLSNSSSFQGGLYAANDVSVGNSASFEGPMMGGSLDFSNSVQARPFPVINTVPLGTPGNPNIYAKPQGPRNFSG